MRRTIGLTALVAGLLLALPAGGASAQGNMAGQVPARGRVPARGPAHERADARTLAALTRGAELVNDGQTYVLLPEARAVRAQHSGEASTQALTRLGLPGRSVLERKGAFVLFREIAPVSTATGPAASQDSLPVLLNTKTGALAVVAGTIRVRLHVAGDAEAVAAAHGLTVSNQFPHLKTAFYEAPVGADLAAAAKALAADPRVADAGLELIERVLSPR